MVGEGLVVVWMMHESHVVRNWLIVMGVDRCVYKIAEMQSALCRSSAERSVVDLEVEEETLRACLQTLLPDDAALRQSEAICMRGT